MKYSKSLLFFSRGVFVSVWCHGSCYDVRVSFRLTDQYKHKVVPYSFMGLECGVSIVRSSS
jgi:hypothetical protein